MTTNRFKVKETDTHIYFLSGPLSQWHPSRFTAKIDDKSYKFTCAEQYMMASKAKLFHDDETFDKIMATDKPNKHKNYGKMVKNFQQSVWDENCTNIVFQGNYARAQHDYEYLETLRDSGNKILVEGSAYDTIWGVGLSWDDPAILNEANWRGTNFLGNAHMRVRNTPMVNAIIRYM